MIGDDNARRAAEAIEAINETYRTGDTAVWRRLAERVCDPDVVLNAPGEAFTEGDWRGHDGIVAFVANQMEVLEDMWLRLEELIEVDPDTVVAGISFGGRARYSELAVDLHPWHLLKSRDGLVIRWEIFLEREQALEAARR